jgi:hypothetical protein
LGFSGRHCNTKPTPIRQQHIIQAFDFSNEKAGSGGGI